MPPKQTKVSLKSQLEEAERKGLEKGMDAVLAALKAAHPDQLSRYLYISDEYYSLQVRLDAATVNAAKENQIELVLSLLKAGASIETCNENEQSVLFIAVRKGHTELVKALLKAGVNPNFLGEEQYTTPLACAAKRGFTEIAVALLKAGADVHEGGEPEQANWLINYAAPGDQVELTRAFIKAGVNMESHIDEYETPLLSAAYHGKAKSAALLIKAGCEVNARNYRGETALMLAAKRNEKDTLATIKLLFKAGAEVNSKDDNGRTALICAARTGQTKAVRLLLSAGADVFCRARIRLTRDSAAEIVNAFELASKAAVKEIIKSEMHRRIAAALSVLPLMPVDVRQKVIQLYIEESGVEEAYIDTDSDSDIYTDRD